MRKTLSAILLALAVCGFFTDSSSAQSGGSAADASATSPERAASAGALPALASPPGAAPSPGQSLQVLYTGKLYGYFRVPELQPADSTEGCLTDPATGGSPAAQRFHQLLTPGVILVGTGDNFAPRLEARQFSGGPQLSSGTTTYGKELYIWVPAQSPSRPAGEWVRYDDRRLQERSFRDLISRGWGFVPTDNVACFLKLEGYDAVVPGKHDFYFGPERLRELAHFLASTADSAGHPLHPVQMLGTNLVVETSWKADHEALPDTDRNLKYIPPGWPFAPGWPKQFGGATPGPPLAGGPPPVPAPLAPADGGKAYPWFVGPRVKLLEVKSPELQKLLREGAQDMNEHDFLQFLANHANPGPPTPECPQPCRDEMRKEVGTLQQIADAFQHDEVRLCRSSKPGDPNALALDGAGQCPELPRSRRRTIMDKATVEYLLPFSEVPDVRLEPGANYGLCLRGTNLPAPTPTPRTNPDLYCIRFSVFVPLLQFHVGRPPAGITPAPDPEPYALVRANAAAGRTMEAAIFGVIDPGIAEYVGALNLDWWNTDPQHQAHPRDKEDSRYKTLTAIKDPAEALREAVDHFAYNYELKSGKPFTGVRILLAEMSPPVAEVLAKRVGGFQVVVSAADPELDEEDVDRVEHAAADGETDPAFLAVPPPYSVDTRKPASERLQVGRMTLGHQSHTWTYTRDLLRAPPDRVWGRCEIPTAGALAVPGKSPDWFWDSVQSTLAQRCGAPRAPVETCEDKQKAIQELTLCAMQDRVKADVALLQERDLYLERVEKPRLGLQQRLDRIIWKGDFLTLVYVPGSALLGAIKKSKDYQAKESSELALVDERHRGLVWLGIAKGDRDEYRINEAPIDPTRLYGVALSEYIGVGDTGYHDLIAATVEPPQLPEDFGSALHPISSVVCEFMTRRGNRSCLGQLTTSSYFDEIAVRPPDTDLGNTTRHQLWMWARSVFYHGRKVPPATPSISEPAGTEAAVQQRGLGAVRINPPAASAFTIEKASFAVSALDHKFTEPDLAAAFPGSPVTQLQTPRKHNFSVDVRPQYSYSWHKVEVFEAVEFRYGTTYQGRVDGNRIVNQSDNLFSSDTGVAFHLSTRDLPRLKATRAFPRLEPVFTFHYETQLINPLPNLFLTAPKGDTVAPFENSRTHLLLPRAGLRLVNRQSWIEAGLEDGGELNAVRLTFVPPPPAKGATIFVTRPNIRLAGAYWRWHLVVPINPSVSWTVDEDGDLFFNRKDDAPTDERFRSDTKVALNFQVWPSLSFAPTFEMFGYSNKVQGIWFWQDQASIQVNVRFDFWNHRQWRKQIKYKPAAK
jgi:hypothetical protein